MASSNFSPTLKESLKIFDLLNLEGQTEESLKKIFHILSHKYHPDKNPNVKGANLNFIKAKESYEFLKKRLKKQKVDQSNSDQNSAKYNKQKSYNSNQNNTYKTNKEDVKAKYSNAGKTENEEAKTKAGNAQSYTEKETSKEKANQKNESTSAGKNRNEQNQSKQEKTENYSYNKDDSKKSTTEDFKQKKDESFKYYTNSSTKSYSNSKDNNTKPKQDNLNTVFVQRFVIAGLSIFCILLLGVIVSSQNLPSSVASNQSSSVNSFSNSQISINSSSKSSYSSISSVSSVSVSDNNGDAIPIFQDTKLGTLFWNQIERSTEYCMNSSVVEYGIGGGGIFAQEVNSKKSTASFTEVSNFLNTGQTDKVGYISQPFRQSCSAAALIYIGKIDLEYPGTDKVQAFYAKQAMQPGQVSGVSVFIIAKKGSRYVLFQKPIVRYDDIDRETFCNNANIQVVTTEECVQEKMVNDKGLKEDAMSEAEILKKFFVFI